jgi:hypothetical protein
MSGAISPIPRQAFMAWCSVKAQEQKYLKALHRHDKTNPILPWFNLSVHVFPHNLHFFTVTTTMCTVHNFKLLLQ